MLTGAALESNEPELPATLRREVNSFLLRNRLVVVIKKITQRDVEQYNLPYNL